MVERKYFHDLFGGEASEGSVAESVILVNDPLRVKPLSVVLDDVVPVADHYEFRLVTGWWHGLPVSVCSTGLGGGSTSIGLDNLVRIGAKNFIYIDAGIADKDDQGVFVATGAVRCDGASLDYARAEFPAAVDPEVYLALLSADLEIGLKLKPALMLAAAGPLPREKLHEFLSYNASSSAVNKNFAIPIKVTGPEVATILTLCTIYRLRVGAVYGGTTSREEAVAAVPQYFKLALHALKQLKRWDEEKARLGWKIMTPSIPVK